MINCDKHQIAGLAGFLFDAGDGRHARYFIAELQRLFERNTARRPHPAGQGNGAEGETLFLQVTEDGLRLNTASLSIDKLSARLSEVSQQEGTRLLLSLSGDVTSQRLTDILVVLRTLPKLKLSILAPT